MGALKTCRNCQHWDIANAGPPRLRESERWEYDSADDAKRPHANLRFSKCFAAERGWEDTYDPATTKMAVWDGSNYMAELLTRDDHVCGEHVSRSEPSPKDSAS